MRKTILTVVSASVIAALTAQTAAAASNHHRTRMNGHAVATQQFRNSNAYAAPGVQCSRRTCRTSPRERRRLALLVADPRGITEKPRGMPGLLVGRRRRCLPIGPHIRAAPAKAAREGLAGQGKNRDTSDPHLLRSEALIGDAVA
jgi:hypothetical protein